MLTLPVSLSPRVLSQEMGHYDIALVCLNGHMVNDQSRSSPQHNETHCRKCGAATIRECPECKHPIKGDYICDVIVVGAVTPTPTHCTGCGKPYPWHSKIEHTRENAVAAQPQKTKARGNYTAAWIGAGAAILAAIIMVVVPLIFPTPAGKVTSPAPAITPVMPDAEKRRFRVYANAQHRTPPMKDAAAWQDTGVQVHKGDKLEISYQSGEWYFGNPDDVREDGSKPHRALTGDGDIYAKILPNMKSTLILDSALMGSLIGKVGNNNPFPVGNNYPNASSADEGALSLMMNDATIDQTDPKQFPGFTDNRGALEVLIIRTPPIKSSEK